jgi:hypothetical protein
MAHLAPTIRDKLLAPILTFRSTPDPELRGLQSRLRWYQQWFSSPRAAGAGPVNSGVRDEEAPKNQEHYHFGPITDLGTPVNTPQFQCKPTIKRDDNTHLTNHAWIRNDLR